MTDDLWTTEPPEVEGDYWVKQTNLLALDKPGKVFISRIKKCGEEWTCSWGYPVGNGDFRIIEISRDPIPSPEELAAMTRLWQAVVVDGLHGDCYVVNKVDEARAHYLKLKAAESEDKP